MAGSTPSAPIFGPEFGAGATRASRLERMLRFGWRTYRLEVSNALEYRGSLIGWVLLGTIPLVAAYVLWTAVFRYSSSPTIAGYNFSELITYQFMATMLFQINLPWSVQSQVSAEIRLGEINRYLLRPIPYGPFRALRYAGYNTVFVSLWIVPTALILLSLGDDLVFVSAEMTMYALIGAALGFWLQFVIVYCLALNAFWFDEVFGLFLCYQLISRFSSGELVPLELLPGWLYDALQYTPFPGIAWAPLRTYLGKLSPDEILRHITTTACWLVAFMCLARWLWWRGIRKYSAFGG